MTMNLPSAQEGCLLLADITGYTAYLQGTELEHAQDVLTDLLETIISGVEPPFELSKLEGDAVFAHMPTAVIDAPMLFDTIEATYFAFRRRLRDVVNGTTCDCNACVLIPTLDLKFVVHSGEYVVRKIARTEELTGADVVLVHRLLKGSARDVVGNDAYLVLTRSVMDTIGGDADALGLSEHVEHLDIGDTDVFIANLEERWKLEESRTHSTVSAESAHGVFRTMLPGTPREAWPYMTDPRKRLEYQVGLTAVGENVDGRRGVGTMNHCAHGERITLQQVMDWQPFSSFTTRDELEGMDIVLRTTTTFVQQEVGTEMTLYFACDPAEAWPELEAGFFPVMESTAQNLAAILDGSATPK